MRTSNNKNLKPIQLQVALVPVCKIVIRLGMHFHEFVRNLQKAYIKAAEDILNESNVKISHQAIAVKTGMDRRTISEHKNNISRSYTDPMNKMDMIILQLQRLCINNKNKPMSLKQIQGVIDAVYANHIRSSAVIVELISNKIIITDDNIEFKINSKLSNNITDTEGHAKVVDQSAKRLFTTFYQKLFGNKNQAKLHFSTISSTKITTKKQQIIKQQIQKETEKFEKRIKKILQQNESTVAEGTYNEFGITNFQFEET